MPRPEPLANRTGGEALLIAQITDLHVSRPGVLVNGRVDSHAHLERAVAQLAAADPAPDLILATGDLVDRGHPEEYARLRALLAPLAAPVFLIPGNHDDRTALVEAFPDHTYLPRRGILNYAIEDYPVRLLALDTTEPGLVGGVFGPERRAWLAEALAADRDRPTLLFMHHPPIATGMASMDEIGVAPADAAALADIVRAHPQVERVLCGHVHRSIQARWAGTLVSVAPSTAHQLALDLDPQGGSAFVMEPPGYHLHWFRRGAPVVTHGVPVGRYDGPYRS